MSLPEKQITALIEPSGCGKSTFLKSLNRMNDLVEGCRIEGEITLDCADIYKDFDVNILRTAVVWLSSPINSFPQLVPFPLPAACKYCSTRLCGISHRLSDRKTKYHRSHHRHILKTECIHRTKIKSFAEARDLIYDYIYFYNYQRIQLRTKLTPLELRSQFVA